MEITIQGTEVLITGDRVIGFQLNNLVNTFTATTDKDENWSYQLKVFMVKLKKYNVWNLNREGQTLSVDLTSDMMPIDGRYVMQFVARNGEQIDHTDTFEVWVQLSLDPSVQYDPVPSEFYQIENNIQNIYNQAQELYSQIEQGDFTSIKIIDGGTATT